MLVPPQEQKVLNTTASLRSPEGQQRETLLVVKTLNSTLWFILKDMPEVHTYTHSWTVANGLAGWSCKYSLNSNLKEKELNNQVDRMTFCRGQSTFTPILVLSQRAHEQSDHCCRNKDCTWAQQYGFPLTTTNVTTATE